VRFRLARFVDEGTYAVRRRIPPGSHSQLDSLTAELRRVRAALLHRHKAARSARAPVATGA
jgi:hypothetical protein